MKIEEMKKKKKKKKGRGKKCTQYRIRSSCLPPHMMRHSTFREAIIVYHLHSRLPHRDSHD
jgi:ribulose-5-phosphate 4-epimerase/fuculose-1-phosphate aldolase